MLIPYNHNICIKYNMEEMFKYLVFVKFITIVGVFVFDNKNNKHRTPKPEEIFGQT